MISVDHCPAELGSVARWPRLVCPRGPVVPAWLGLGVPGSRIGGPGAPFGVPAWSRVPGLAWVGCPRIQNRLPGGPVRCARLVP